MGWDLVLFYVAHMLGRRTSILSRTLLEDRVYFNEDFRTELPIRAACRRLRDSGGLGGP